MAWASGCSQTYESYVVASMFAVCGCLWYIHHVVCWLIDMTLRSDKQSKSQRVKESKTHTDTPKNTHTDTHRHTHTQTHTYTHKHTHAHTHTHSHTHAHAQFSQCYHYMYYIYYMAFNVLGVSAQVSSRDPRSWPQPSQQNATEKRK
jgi:ABC-type Zn2+ transport system substrate-binding protein/surface adhesin